MRVIIALALLALCSYQVVQPAKKVHPQLEPYALTFPSVKSILTEHALPFAIALAIEATIFGIGLAKSIDTRKKLTILQKLKRHLSVNTIDAKTLQSKELLDIAINVEKLPPKKLKVLQKIIKSKKTESQIRTRKILWDLICVGSTALGIITLLQYVDTCSQTYHKRKSDILYKQRNTFQDLLLAIPENKKFEQSTALFYDQNFYRYADTKRYKHLSEIDLKTLKNHCKILEIEKIVVPNQETRVIKNLQTHDNHIELYKKTIYDKLQDETAYLITKYETRATKLLNFLAQGTYNEGDDINNVLLPEAWKYLDLEQFQNIWRHCEQHNITELLVN